MTKKLTRKLIAFGITTGLVSLTANRFKRWRQQRIHALQTGGRIVQTACGPVEYAMRGEGPVVLLAHGAPGGYDQIDAIDGLVSAGFCVLCPSRPGYLLTPLSNGRSLPAQADMMVALLDALGIDKAAIVGASAGGPIALQMALRHPQRLWAMGMLSGVAHEYHPSAELEHSVLGRLFLTDTGAQLMDIGAWLLERSLDLAPAQVAEITIATESSLSKTQVSTKVQQIMQDPAQRAAFRALMLSTTPFSLRRAGLENDLVQLGQIPHYPLAEITTPTFVIHGRFDADAVYSHAEFVVNTIPHAHLITHEHSGHLTWLGDEWKKTLPQFVTFLRTCADSKMVYRSA